MFTFMLLILILLKLSEKTHAAQVSTEDFYRCAYRLQEPLILVKHRRIMWLLGSGRYQYTLVFQGLTLYVNSFKPLAGLEDYDQLKIVTW